MRRGCQGNIGSEEDRRAQKAPSDQNVRHQSGRGKKNPQLRRADRLGQDGRGCSTRCHEGRIVEMPILVGRNTRTIVQGITGNQGSFHTKLMLEYGTKIAAGVTPGKGGTTVQGVAVFDTVAAALEKVDANSSIIFVP